MEPFLQESLMNRKFKRTELFEIKTHVDYKITLEQI